MNHCNDSENDIHRILCVKLEPFEEDEDCTQNLDPLQPDSDVHTKVELLQDLKMEIESDGSEQAMNELIQEDILKDDPGDTATEIEEINIKTEYIGNEASTFDNVQDSRRIIKVDTSLHSQLAEKNSSTNTGEKNTTRDELSHEPQRSDVINEKCMNDGSYTDNHSRVRSDTRSSGVDVPGIRNHSSSKEEGSKQSSSLIAQFLRHTSYVCDVCHMEFKNSRKLVKYEVVHTGQMPHVCDVCKKGFCFPSGLVKHKRIHTGEKPYVCDICKKGFSRSSSLVTHNRIHSGQKPYVCDICKKRFSQSSHLVQHKRIHTGQKLYICDICKNGFHNASAVVRHRRIYSGQKPYACDICKKGFTTSSNLVVHKRTQSGQKF